MRRFSDSRARSVRSRTTAARRPEESHFVERFDEVRLERHVQIVADKIPVQFLDDAHRIPLAFERCDKGCRVAGAFEAHGPEFAAPPGKGPSRELGPGEQPEIPKTAGDRSAGGKAVMSTLQRGQRRFRQQSRH